MTGKDVKDEKTERKSDEQSPDSAEKRNASTRIKLKLLKDAFEGKRVYSPEDAYESDVTNLKGEVLHYSSNIPESSRQQISSTKSVHSTQSKETNKTSSFLTNSEKQKTNPLNTESQKQARKNVVSYAPSNVLKPKIIASSIVDVEPLNWNPKYPTAENPSRKKKYHSKRVHSNAVQGSDNTEFRLYAMMHDFRERLDESPFDILPIPKALTREQVKLFFRRGFRADQINIDEKVCFLPWYDYTIPEKIEEQEKTDPIIYLSESQEPIDFLVSLGFDVDESALALRHEDIKRRLQAALVEARIWASFLTVTQGTLLFFISQVMNEKVIRFFLHIVEAIVNNRITNATQIDAFMRVLLSLEKGSTQLLPESPEVTSLFSLGPATDKKQLVTRFIDLYSRANEASLLSRGHHIGEKETLLLEYLVLKYRPALQTHVDLLASYIGHGLIRTKMQLDAAIMFLTRYEKSNFDILELETFCGINAPMQDDKSVFDGWRRWSWLRVPSVHGESAEEMKKISKKEKEETEEIVKTIVRDLIDVALEPRGSSLSLAESDLQDIYGRPEDKALVSQITPEVTKDVSTKGSPEGAEISDYILGTLIEKTVSASMDRAGRLSLSGKKVDRSVATDNKGVHPESLKKKTVRIKEDVNEPLSDSDNSLSDLSHSSWSAQMNPIPEMSSSVERLAARRDPPSGPKAAERRGCVSAMRNMFMKLIGFGCLSGKQRPDDGRRPLCKSKRRPESKRGPRSDFSVQAGSSPSTGVTSDEVLPAWPKRHTSTSEPVSALQHVYTAFLSADRGPWNESSEAGRIGVNNRWSENATEILFSRERGAEESIEEQSEKRDANPGIIETSLADPLKLSDPCLNTLPGDSCPSLPDNETQITAVIVTDVREAQIENLEPQCADIDVLFQSNTLAENVSESLGKDSEINTDSDRRSSISSPNKLQSDWSHAETNLDPTPSSQSASPTQGLGCFFQSFDHSIKLDETPFIMHLMKCDQEDSVLADSNVELEQQDTKKCNNIVKLHDRKTQHENKIIFEKGYLEEQKKKYVLESIRNAAVHVDSPVKFESTTGGSRQTGIEIGHQNISTTHRNLELKLIDRNQETHKMEQSNCAELTDNKKLEQYNDESHANNAKSQTDMIQSRNVKLSPSGGSRHIGGEQAEIESKPNHDGFLSQKIKSSQYGNKLEQIKLNRNPIKGVSPKKFSETQYRETEIQSKNINPSLRFQPRDGEILCDGARLLHKAQVQGMKKFTLHENATDTPKVICITSPAKKRYTESMPRERVSSFQKRHDLLRHTERRRSVSREKKGILCTELRPKGRVPVTSEHNSRRRDACPQRLPVDGDSLRPPRHGMRAPQRCDSGSRRSGSGMRRMRFTDRRVASSKQTPSAKPLDSSGTGAGAATRRTAWRGDAVYKEDLCRQPETVKRPSHAVDGSLNEHTR